MHRRIVSRASPSYARIRRAQFRSKRLRAAAGSFALTGEAADLRLIRGVILSAGSGSFAVSGQDAALLRAKRLAAGQGAFAITSQDATLRKGKSLAADVGSFSLTGQDAGLKRACRIVADSGAFSLTGTTATMRKGLNLVADAGGFALTGQAAGLRVSRKLAAASGTFALNGQAASLKTAKRIAAEGGTFTVTGQDATLTKSASLTCDFVSSAQSALGGGGTIFTLSGMSFGAADSTRYLAVAIGLFDGNGNSRTFSTVTIGGVSASPLVTNGGDALTQSAIWIAAVPTGTSGDVVVTLSGSIPGSASQRAVNVILYRITNLLSTTPVATNNANGNSALTLSLSGSTAGGCAIAAAGEYAGTSVWAGFATSKDATLSAASGPSDFSSVHALTPSGGALTSTYSTPSNRGTGVSVSLR